MSKLVLDLLIVKNNSPVVETAVRIWDLKSLNFAVLAVQKGYLGKYSKDSYFVRVYHLDSSMYLDSGRGAIPRSWPFNGRSFEMVPLLVKEDGKWGVNKDVFLSCHFVTHI